MAGEADGDQVRTALVVLAAPNPPGSDSAGRPRAVMVRDRNAYDRAFGRVDRDRNDQLSRTELGIG